jgi:serine/alanine adding enzyme
MNLGSETYVRIDRLAIEQLSSGQEELWDTFVEACPNGSVYHCTVWRKLIKELFGHESFYLYARSDDGAIIGVLPLIRLKSRLFGDFLISVPYVNYGGAIATTVAVEEALMKAAVTLAQDLGAGHIEFRDNRPRGDWPVRTDKVAMELPLPAEADELWSSLSSKVRAQIKRPIKEGVTVAEGGKELLPNFYRVFSRNMRDLGTPVYPRQLFTLILQTFPQHARIIVLKLEGKPVAASFLLGFRGRLEIPWASSIGEFNRLGVNMLLYWESLKAAISDGYGVFDFGRSTVDSGTYRFKKQWGAQQKQLYWHYWLPVGQDIPQLTPRNPRYRLAVGVWQHLPLWLANHLGPRIVRNLP